MGGGGVMAIEPLKRTTKISEDQSFDTGGQEHVVVVDPASVAILKKILERFQVLLIGLLASQGVISLDTKKSLLLAV